MAKSKRLARAMATLILALVFIATGTIGSFAQTGLGVTTSYYSMPVNHVRIDNLNGASAIFSTTNSAFQRVTNWDSFNSSLNTYYYYPAAIVYRGPLTWGSKNQSGTQNAVLGEKVIPGSFSLRFPNAATTYDGQKKDLVITVSDVRLYMGARPSGVSSGQSLYLAVAVLGNPGAAFVNQHARTSTARSTTIKSSQASRYKIDTQIVEPGTNTPIDSKYSSVLMKFYDIDVPDNTAKNNSYSGRFAEGVGLISGFHSPYLVYPNSMVVSQTVDGVQKIRGSQRDSETDRSAATLSAAPQGFSYYWYGSMEKGSGKPTLLATSAGTTPVVSVDSSSGDGGDVDKEGINYFGINMPQPYTYTPEPGWVVKSITAGGIPQPINDENLHGGTYTFEKLTDNNSFRAEFEPPQVAVTKEADKQYYQLGDIVTYTIKLKNLTGVMSVDFAKEQLQSLVDDSLPFLEETDKWTEESLQALSDEIDAAKALLENPDATIPELQEEMQRLSDKVAGLVEREATPAEMLAAKIEEARELLNTGVTYTDETRQALEDAIAAGEALTDPTDEEAFDAIAAIDEAMDNLRIEGEEDIRDLLAVLKDKIEDAEAILENADDYPADQVSALQSAYEAADEIVASAEEEQGSVSNEDVKDATSALEEALSNMETISDAYDRTFSEAEALLSSTDYTDDSLEALQEVLDDLTANPPATNDEKMEAISRINDAVDALEPKRSNSSNSFAPSPSFAPLTNLPKMLNNLLGGPLRAPAPSYDYPGTYDTNVVLTEELPDYLQMVGYKVSGGSVEVDHNKLTFTVDVLGDEEFEMTVRARVIKDTGAPVDVKNEVNVKGDISPEEANAEETITVVRPVLEVEKTADKEKYHKGDTVHYTISVENTAENSWANNVLVTDSALSKGQVVVPGSVTCSDDTAVITEENGTFKVNIPELLGLEKKTVEFDATIVNEDIESKTLSNTATAVCDQDDEPKEGTAESTIVYDVSYEWEGDHPDIDVPEGTEDIPWGDEYDVDESFKAGDKVKDVVDGQKGSWVFGGWDKTGTLVIKDDTVIKGSWTFIPEYDIVTSAVNGTITPTERDIPKSENRVITYTPNAGYQLKTIIVDGEEKDIKEYPSSYTFENISKDHTIDVVFELIPGLEVIKDADKEIYNAGDTVTYTITVKQTVEGAEARDVVLTDNLPEGLTLNRDSFSDNVEVIEAGDRSYKISIPSLEDEITYTYTAVTEEDVDHEELINLANASGSNVPEEAEDNAKVKSLTPKPEIEKIVSNENPIYGEEITYWIKIKEPQEGIELRNAKVDDALPEGVAYEGGETSLTGNEGEFTISEDGKFEASVPVLKDESVFSFKVKVTAIEGEVDNIATLTGTAIKPLTDNAIFTVKEPEPELKKEVSKEEASVGDTISYTITASSEIALVDAVLEDKIPEGVELIEDSVKCSDQEAEISVKSDLITAKVKSLGEAITITYDAKVKAVGELLNTVELAAYNFPKGPAKAEAKVIGFKPVPVIEKEADSDEVHVRDDISYTVKAYTPKGTIYNAVITDKIPRGLTLDEGSVKASAGEVHVVGNTIVVKAATLAQDPIIITYTVEATKSGEHINEAVLSGDNVDAPAVAEATVEAIASPSTGDSLPVLPFAVFGASALALAGYFVYRRRVR